MRSRTVPSLTKRERDVLQGLAEGLRVSGIAARLYVSQSTVKTQAMTLYGKLGARTAANAVHIAHRLNLLPGPSESEAEAPGRVDQLLEDMWDLAQACEVAEFGLTDAQRYDLLRAAAELAGAVAKELGAAVLIRDEALETPLEANRA